MQQLTFEYHPLFIVLCIVLGIIYGWLQYQNKGTWGPLVNKVLFALRTILVTLLAIFLVSPILRQIINEVEKPTYVIAIDNSTSLTQFRTEEELAQLMNSLKEEEARLKAKGFNVDWKDLNGEAEDIAFDTPLTNLASFLDRIQTEYEGKNLSGITLLSDGIYNKGMSPAFSNYSFEINTIVVGDTLAKADVMINTLLFNRLSYQGNKFPISVQYSQKGYDNESAVLRVKNGQQTVFEQTVTLPPQGQIKEERLLMEANESGFQRYEVSISRKPDELTYDNNVQTAFVEIIDGQESIALIASSPHPDIKALRSAVESNANYDFQQFILSNPKDVERLKNSPKKFDLAIFHQLPNTRDVDNTIISDFEKLSISTLTILGSQSELNLFNNANALVDIDASAGEYDQITAAFNRSFENFKLSDELQSSFDQFPPLTVPFGKYTGKPESSVLLYQRVGNITTSRPLLAVKVEDDIKRAVFTGQGIWKWKLTDYANNGDNLLFNELITKLVQYLSTKDDKRKVKIYPLKNEYSTRESIVFETQVYNDLYEEIYGNQIQLRLTNQDGEVSEYDYTTSESNTQYTVTGLPEGIYQYKASTEVNGSVEVINGEIIVKSLQLESQNLIADFALLRKLSESNGGDFFLETQFEALANNLREKEPQGVIHSKEEILPFINLEWILILLLGLLSIEWFIRKYHGSY